MRSLGWVGLRVIFDICCSALKDKPPVGPADDCGALVVNPTSLPTGSCRDSQNPEVWKELPPGEGMCPCGFGMSAEREIPLPPWALPPSGKVLPGVGVELVFSLRAIAARSVAGHHRSGSGPLLRQL